jgi:heat induced stress protein YflT
MADLNPPRLDPVSMAWNTVASYPSYEEAQAAVDRLSDERFPVENLDIVGSGLRLVERVTGRLTNARAAAAGAASSAWFGLFSRRCQSAGGLGYASLWTVTSAARTKNLRWLKEIW